MIHDVEFHWINGWDEYIKTAITKPKKSEWNYTNLLFAYKSRQRLIDKIKKARPISRKLLYRGTGFDKKYEFLKRNISFKNITSFSSNVYISDDFAKKSEKKYNVLFVLKNDQNFMKLSKKLRIDNYYYDESEYLMYNRKFRIIDIYKDPDIKHYYIINLSSSHSEKNKEIIIPKKIIKKNKYTKKTMIFMDNLKAKEIPNSTYDILYTTLTSMFDLYDGYDTSHVPYHNYKNLNMFFHMFEYRDSPKVKAIFKKFLKKKTIYMKYVLLALRLRILDDHCKRWTVREKDEDQSTCEEILLIRNVTHVKTVKHKNPLSNSYGRDLRLIFLPPFELKLIEKKKDPEFGTVYVIDIFAPV